MDKIISYICTSCSSKDVQRLDLRSELKYKICMACGHCEKLITSGTAEDEFETAQARYFGEDSAVLKAQVSPFEVEILAKRVGVVSKWLEPKRTVAEVGPGAGSFLRWLQQSGHCAIAIEHAPDLARILARKYLISVVTGEFEETEIASNSVDAFCSFHVIEHVRDPSAHIAKAFDIVKPGGHAFIATPNAKSWEQMIPGNLSPNYDSAHLSIFSRASLRTLCEAGGWSVLEQRTEEYTIAWLRVFSKVVRRMRGEHEEDTAGKYLGSSSAAFRTIIGVVRAATWPMRFVQGRSGGGNELFFVLKKPAQAEGIGKFLC